MTLTLKVTGLLDHLRLCNHFAVKVHELVQTSAVFDSVRGMTAKTFKTDEYELFKQLFVLCFCFVLFLFLFCFWFCFLIFSLETQHSVTNIWGGGGGGGEAHAST